RRLQCYVKLTVANMDIHSLPNIEAVLGRTWEILNTGHWKDVPLAPRQLYTAAAIVKIAALLKCYKEQQANKLELLQSAMKTADLGIMLGASLSAGNCNMTQVAQLLSEALTAIQSEANNGRVNTEDGTNIYKPVLGTESIAGVRGQPVITLDRPSLEKFRTEHFVPQVPAKLTSCMMHWPAVDKWKDINYIRRVAGARTVPVELGSHYVDPEWSMKMMTIADFIETHIMQQRDDSTTVGYLAQHPLFDLICFFFFFLQVPELIGDIFEPEYCCLSEDLDDSKEAEPTDINAWFGPKGTLSPLHHDPKHNLLAQVVGEKRILLYSPGETEKLYPHEGSMLNNTAQVNPEKPDYSTFPKYKTAQTWECHLQPGEMLYIPPKWWHHVRSLCTSFSVSFWWT
ncbi:hypothetical protein L9F63_000672, partial [Diploptera punctata]